jgi:hypothetical protein
MTEATFKAPSWRAQGRPAESRELADSRQLIREVIFSLHRQKSDILSRMGMPSQPVSLGQIYLEICSRIALLRDCRRWPYRVHEKRWWDRRVNEVSCKSYYVDGVPKVIAITAGYYAPNSQLFERKTVEDKINA